MLTSTVAIQVCLKMDGTQTWLTWFPIHSEPNIIYHQISYPILGQTNKTIMIHDIMFLRKKTISL